ncbi:serine hydrolase domain-containing protein [Aquisalimonas asiatica]|uniref:CubicO group peptidase, beta-lactamase class C family n=1 Tax=Aquisalimonas asiatica TaxID=406100 RepID=A0A1H8U115_9GAMM|nr:serine hydrolase [Aquisalimonas asiatica]SEO96338.1 CubicO group peptidase, beta-lactamase class C family [Aquisalimonas asiatica]
MTFDQCLRETPRRLVRWIGVAVGLVILGVAAGVSAGETRLERVEASAASMERLHSLLVLVDGEPRIERVFQGGDLETPVNIKSVSKTVLSALVGAAIQEGVLTGVDQSIADALGGRLPPDADPAVADITIGHLLSMQSGLERTSGANYGTWVASSDWVADALRRPMVGEPGGRMRYSTGNSHLLSAALVEQSGQTTLELARRWLGAPLNIRVPDWLRDPQGVHFGGNEMRLSPRALARFGELYRLGGEIGGQRILAEEWIDASWTPRGRSRFTNDAYGYGWFITDLNGHRAYYGWGFGGQMLYVVPDLRMTVVLISDPNPPSPGGAYRRQLERLVADQLIPAVQAHAASAE